MKITERQEERFLELESKQILTPLEEQELQNLLDYYYDQDFGPNNI